MYLELCHLSHAYLSLLQHNKLMMIYFHIQLQERLKMKEKRAL